MKNQKTDICIVGNGLVGQVAAIALAKEGYEVTICAPQHVGPDRRTTALLMDSVKYLDKLGVWSAASENAHPLKTMRIVDSTNRLIRAPQSDFHATEIGLEAFGYNVQNEEFSGVLGQVASESDAIQSIDCSVTKIRAEDGRMLLVANGSEGPVNLNAGFVVGADGRNSLVRTQMNAGEREWHYPQAAIVVDFEHEFSTRFTSTEFHTETGPFTIVPRSETVAGLVWMETPDRASQITALSRGELAKLLEQKMQSFLGKVKILTEAQYFPLKGLVANRLGSDNWALVGEAAHVFPPIGAQGFNLGIRDVEALAHIMGRHTSAEDRGHHYDQARRPDVNIRSLGVDLLNRSLISDLLPMQVMRGAGLYTLNSWPGLRKMIMRMGISPQFRTG